MKEITAENKFLAGVKNQCSVRKAGIGKPEQGVRQNSSKNLGMCCSWMLPEYHWISNGRKTL